MGTGLGSSESVRLSWVGGGDCVVIVREGVSMASVLDVDTELHEETKIMNTKRKTTEKAKQAFLMAGLGRMWCVDISYKQFQLPDKQDNKIDK